MPISHSVQLEIVVAEGQLLTNSPAVLMCFRQMLWVWMFMSHIFNIQMKMCSSGKLHLSGCLEKKRIRNCLDLYSTLGQYEYILQV